jgi:hypothetical protein
MVNQLRMRHLKLIIFQMIVCKCNIIKKYRLLFIIYYLLFIIYYLLFIIYYLLFIIYYLLFIIY